MLSLWNHLLHWLCDKWTIGAQFPTDVQSAASTQAVFWSGFSVCEKCWHESSGERSLLLIYSIGLPLCNPAGTVYGGEGRAASRFMSPLDSPLQWPTGVSIGSGHNESFAMRKPIHYTLEWDQCVISHKSPHNHLIVMTLSLPPNSARFEMVTYMCKILYPLARWTVQSPLSCCLSFSLILIAHLHIAGLSNVIKISQTWSINQWNMCLSQSAQRQM